MRRNHALALLALCFTLALAATAARAGDPPPKHPLAVLKAIFSPDDGRGMGAMRGEATIWLKNMSDVAVDGVKVDLELYNQNGRKVETLTKDVGELPAGDKRYLQYKFEIYGATQLKPRIWVYYNGGGEKPVKFEGDPPVWSGG